MLWSCPTTKHNKYLFVVVFFLDGKSVLLRFNNLIFQFCVINTDILLWKENSVSAFFNLRFIERGEYIIFFPLLFRFFSFTYLWNILVVEKQNKFQYRLYCNGFCFYCQRGIYNNNINVSVKWLDYINSM